MGRINAIIPDDLETKIRVKATQKYLHKKGALGLVLAEAVELWLKQEDSKEKTE